MDPSKTKLIGIGLLVLGALVLVGGAVGFLTFRPRDPNAPGWDGVVSHVRQEITKERSTRRNSKGQRRERERTSIDYYLRVKWSVEEEEFEREFAVNSSDFYKSHPVGSKVRLDRTSSNPADAELVQPRSRMAYLLFIVFGAVLGGGGVYVLKTGAGETYVHTERSSASFSIGHG